MATVPTDLSLTRAHARPIADVLTSLRAEDTGLTGDEAAARLEAVGRNVLPEPKRTPAWLRFLGHFNDTLIYILLAAAAIKAVPSALRPVVTPLRLDLRITTSGKEFVIDPGWPPDLHLAVDARLRGTINEPVLTWQARGEGIYSAIALFLYRLF